MSFLTETNLETSIDAARGYRRTSGNKRSKEAASATSGVGLPSASGCKDPMYQEVLSLSSAPELCSGAFSLRTSIADSRSGLIPLAQGTTVNQSPIPLIHLREYRCGPWPGWDSVTYPLDILARHARGNHRALGFSHLSP